ncbi:SusD-like protein P2 [subsurface metagenome]
MKKIIYSLLSICVLFSTSCEKSLDLSPKDQVSDDSFWKSSKDFQLAANNFYFSLMTLSQFIDINSDIAYGLGPDAVSNGSFLATEESSVWNNAYEMIRAVNYLLERAEESTLGDEIAGWVAEARFFRAYNYWKLVKMFGGVPLVDKVLDVNSPELDAPKASQSAVFDFILSDLESAAQKLPKQSELGSGEIGRVTQGAALTLKARVALYEGTWTKYHGGSNTDERLDAAIDATERIISSGVYGLFTGMGDDSYKYLFILEGDDSHEAILGYRYFIDRQVHNWTRWLWFNRMTPSKKLTDLYLCTDGLPKDQSPLFQGYDNYDSEFQNRDPRMAMTIVIPGTTTHREGDVWEPTYPGFLGSNATHTGYMIRKFLGETVDAAQFNSQYDPKEFRYGEVLLILAEALFEKNGSISDADLDRTINLLRDRVNMPHLSNSHVSSNGLDMLAEIRRERTVELALEGFRRDDLRRWKTAETELPEAIKGVKFVGTQYETEYPDIISGVNIQVDENGFMIAEPASGRQFVSAKHYLFPIPLKQIQFSANLEQNPSW